MKEFHNLDMKDFVGGFGVGLLFSYWEIGLTLIFIAFLFAFADKNEREAWEKAKINDNCTNKRRKTTRRRIKR